MNKCFFGTFAGWVLIPVVYCPWCCVSVIAAVVRVSVLLNADATWFERISMLVILLNCVTLGMYRPCLDDSGCDSHRCKILQVSEGSISPEPAFVPASASQVSLVPRHEHRLPAFQGPVLKKIS
jgi:hypothetical protein